MIFSNSWGADKLTPRDCTHFIVSKLYMLNQGSPMEYLIKPNWSVHLGATVALSRAADKTLPQVKLISWHIHLFLVFSIDWDLHEPCHFCCIPRVPGTSHVTLAVTSPKMLGEFLNPVGVPSSNGAISYKSLDCPIQRRTVPWTQNLEVCNKRHPVSPDL